MPTTPRIPTATPTVTPTASMATPLALLGRWRLERVVEDRLADQTWHVTGECRLEQESDLQVRWQETGVLERPGAAPSTVARTLLVVRDDVGAPWRVTFDDGRPFHPWTLGAEVDHPCAADHYRGLVDVVDADRWEVTWEVRGPAKDHTITTTYAACSADAAAPPSGAP